MPNPAADTHLCRVIATPWPGVHATATTSARHFGRHWHATYGIGLLDDGAHRSASGRGEVDAYAGDLLATNPGEVHDGRPLGGPTRRWRIVYFDIQTLRAMVGSGASCAGLELTRPVIREDRALRRHVARLFARFERWSARPGESDLGCDEAMALVCGQLVDRHSTARAAPAPGADVERVRDRLADEHPSPPPLAELAAMVELSRYQLIRRFRDAYGAPPYAWLMFHRCERARRLIGAGSGLAAAAAATGFADQSHMTRVFVRCFGYTPGAWQRACRG